MNLSGRQRLAICGVLVLFTVVGYCQIGRLDFLNYHDPAMVSANPHVLQGLTGENIAWAFSTIHNGSWNPLAWLSLMFDAQCFGGSSLAFHGTNLLLHAMSVVVLFLLLERMTKAVWLSAFAAALFALHPLSVEAVAWVSARKDVLSTFWGLVALAAYVWYAERPGVLRYVLIFPPLALGLMAKPMLVTWPCLFLLVDYWPLKRLALDTTAEKQGPGSSRKSDSKATTPVGAVRGPMALVTEKIPFLALVLVACVVAFYARQQLALTASVASPPWGERIAAGLVAYATYLGKFFWPVGLAIPYPHAIAPTAGQVAIACLVLVGVTALVVWGTRRGHRYLATGWLWYLGTLVPVVGLVEGGQTVTADRLAYVPMIGLAILIAWGADSLVLRWPARRAVVWAVSAVILVACLITTLRQVGFWKNSESLFAHTLEVTDDNVVAHNYLGLQLWQEGRQAEAKTQWEAALEIAPQDPQSNSNIALALTQEKQYDAAARHLDIALRGDPRLENAHNTLATVLFAQGRSDGALRHFEKANRLQPENPTISANLAKLYAARGDFARAAACWQEVLKQRPDDPMALHGAAVALMTQGRSAEAAGYFEQIVQIDPRNAELRNGYGVALAGQGKWKEAVAQWREALDIQPDHGLSLNSLAWALATSPLPAIRDGEEAVQLALKAARGAGATDAAVLDTLAAAYAEAGQFSQAVETADRAITLANRQGNVNLAREIGGRLALYRANTPFRAGGVTKNR